MTTRRDFIKKVTASTAALSFGGVLEGFSAKSYNNIVGANERIKVGAIGVNSRGRALACNFAKQKNCEIAGVCDGRFIRFSASKKIYGIHSVFSGKSIDYFVPFH